MENHPVYSYISAKAAYDPVKTLYVCAPEKDAATLEGLERFALSSGWQAVAEELAAVLVMPLAPGGWAAESPDLFPDLYRQTCRAFHTRSGQSIRGSGGVLWCWETSLYLAGYEEGAVFAGNALVKHPNLFAAAALVNGAPAGYAPGEEPSSHWLVPVVSDRYHRLNRETPVALWLFGGEEAQNQKAAEYFARSGGLSPKGQTVPLDGLTSILCKKDTDAAQVRIFPGNYGAEPGLAQLIAHQLFCRVIRWKNGPDGTLAHTDSRWDFYHSPKYVRHTARAGGNDYDFFVHLPAGMTAKDAAGLPLVFTVHGRGEPAWMFTGKTGWDKLADETRAFVLLSPDSPGNIWVMDRDAEAFPEMIRMAAEIYGIDTGRVYLTGFSNGAVITREAGSLYPRCFAAISPWNGPGPDSISLYREGVGRADGFGPEFSAVANRLLEEDWELPCFFYFGDRDNKALPEDNPFLPVMLRANRCREEGEALNTAAEYASAERFGVTGYRGADGQVRVAVTVMRDMPHGAINDESRACWEQLRHFRRRPGKHTVEYLP